ncbi:hypothetical protein [Candidatus Nitrospira nitrificans]|uniref:Uncharacterized protein n=1 Tax=Candidatus Nitrospira nitrificans TaxID=1742973 RepID=A0A0S4LR01_9BACT|nr:hypothetical protein [Candidatus Nitrospira nitrificans]CUS37522.1 membrane hypothetical protein [Candidatus Nitrospira nitrificans]
MGNIAFTTLVVLLLAIPGYMVRKFYYVEEFTREVLRRSLTEEVYQSILYSLPFHFLTVLAIDALYLSGCIPIYVDYEILLRFLSGMASSDSDGVIKAAESLNRYLPSISIYFALTALLGMLCGMVLRVLVWRYKLDVRYPSLFRFPNRWLYTFTGRDWEKDDEYQYVVLDVICSLTKEKTRLYRGVIFAFETNSNGDLEQIQLGFAYRGKFKEDDRSFYWESVPGDVLVLKYDLVQSLNITRIPESKFNPDSATFLKEEAQGVEHTHGRVIDDPSPTPPSPVA